MKFQTPWFCTTFVIFLLATLYYIIWFILFVGDDGVKQYEFEAKHAAAAEKWVVGVQATLDKVRQPIEGLAVQARK